MQQMSDEQKETIYDQLFQMNEPCFIFCRELHPDEIFMKYAEQYQVPVLMTKQATSVFMAELIRWMNVRLAPCITIHGVLIDHVSFYVHTIVRNQRFHIPEMSGVQMPVCFSVQTADQACPDAWRYSAADRKLHHR